MARQGRRGFSDGSVLTIKRLLRNPLTGFLQLYAFFEDEAERRVTSMAGWREAMSSFRTLSSELQVKFVVGSRCLATFKSRKVSCARTKPVGLIVQSHVLKKLIVPPQG